MEARVKHHGGFRVGDRVEVKIRGIWYSDHYVIEYFQGMRVYVGAINHDHDMIVSIHDIRHPHLVRRK